MQMAGQEECNDPMNEHRHQYATSTLCSVLQVAHACFSQWLHNPVSDREHDNARLLEFMARADVFYYIEVF